MTEEGRLSLGKIDLPSRPVEDDDRSQVSREFLRQPKTPECPHRKADDSEAFFPDRRMDLKASDAAHNLPAGCFLIESRHQLLRSVPGRGGRPAVKVGSESDESGRCEPIAEALEEIVQAPPCMEDEDARPVALPRDCQVSRDLPFRALEFNH